MINLISYDCAWSSSVNNLCVFGRPTVKRLERLVIEAETIPVLLPDLSAVKDLVKKGRDWMNKYKNVKVTFNLKVNFTSSVEL